MSDVTNLSTKTPDGTSLGQSTTDKISLYGVTPIVQRSGSAQAAVDTTAAVSSSQWGFATSTQANAIITLVNELRAWAVAIGGIAGA